MLMGYGFVDAAHWVKIGPLSNSASSGTIISSKGNKSFYKKKQGEQAYEERNSY